MRCSIPHPRGARACRRIRVPIVLLGFATLAACSPDPWTESLVDWRKQLDRADQHSVELGAPARPSKAAENAAGIDDVPAEGALELSPERAVVLALRNNRALSVEQFNPAIAGTFEQIELGIYDPRLFADGSLAREKRSETSRATGDTFNVKGQNSDARVGVAQRLPTGTDVAVDLSTNRAYSNRTSDQHEARAGLTLTQALLQGADPAANLVAVKQARLERDASLFELRGFTQLLVADVEATYWRYALAQREIEIFEQALAVAQQVADEMRTRIEVGDRAPADAAVPDAEVELRRQDLIDAQGRLAVLKLQLLRLISPGGELSPHRELVVNAVPAALPPVDADVEQHVALALQYRPELHEAAVRFEQDRLEVVNTRNGLLPRLDLFITLGRTGFAGSFAEATNAMDGDTYDLTAGLLFEYPLGNREAEALNRQAMLVRDRARQSVLNLRQLVELDVRRAYIEIDRARQQIDATAAARALREQIVQNETAKLNEGKSVPLLVAIAQRDLLESRISEISAIVALKLAIIDLYRLDGTLLNRRGVEVEGQP